MRALVPVALSVVLAAGASVARADLVVDGRGFGHGIGMSQWGAYGYASKTRHTDAYILAHFYPGTRLADGPRRTIRVLLKQGPSLLVSSATKLSVTGRLPIALHPERTYRFEPDGAQLRVVDTSVDRTKARVASGALVTGDGMVRLRGRAENGVMSGRYRSELSIWNDGVTLTAINRLAIERYLLGVVPAEMPSVWPLEALKAQAVAARSYALRSVRPLERFDVFADTRSQMYKGVSGETARTTRAVQDTAYDALYFGGDVAATYFYSSSGGRTADISEEWGGAPVTYLRPVDDPYDSLSPHHRWTVTLATADVQRRLGTLVNGELQRVRVTSRNSSGRVATVELSGSGGVTTATGTQLRSALGLRSTWFYLEFTPATA